MLSFLWRSLRFRWGRICVRWKRSCLDRSFRICRLLVGAGGQLPFPESFWSSFLHYKNGTGNILGYRNVVLEHFFCISASFYFYPIAIQLLFLRGSWRMVVHAWSGFARLFIRSCYYINGLDNSYVEAWLYVAADTSYCATAHFSKRLVSCLLLSSPTMRSTSGGMGSVSSGSDDLRGDPACMGVKYKTLHSLGVVQLSTRKRMSTIIDNTSRAADDDNNNNRDDDDDDDGIQECLTSPLSRHYFCNNRVSTRSHASKGGSLNIHIISLPCHQCVTHDGGVFHGSASGKFSCSSHQGPNTQKQAQNRTIV